MNKKFDINCLEGFLMHLRDYPTVQVIEERESVEALHSIHIIGFHHKQGSILEYSYPDSVNCELLPYLALPDCVHNETEETFFFTVCIEGDLKHCVSCFRQVPNDNVTEEMNRNFVQKALVIVANLPFYALVASRIGPTTQIYFEQKNFKNTEIISEAFESLKASLKDCKVSDLYNGFSIRMLLHVFKEKILMIWKLILLQGRVIVFSKKPSYISSAIYALLSLFPGQLCFGKFQYCEAYYKHLEVYGLPLKIINEDFAFHSYFSIFQLGELEKTGYLIGCTNQMILEHPRSKPNAIINLDTLKIKFSFPNKSQSSLKLNSHETKFIKDLIKIVESSWNKSETWTFSENILWQGSNNFLISEFHKFLKSQLSNLALLQQKLQGVKIETIIKIPKDANSKKFEYNNMNPKLKKIWKYKKFMKGLKGSFLFKWSSCPSFVGWLESHKRSMAYTSEFCGVSQNCEVYYENGGCYRGSLYCGLRHGIGSFETEEFKFEGDWRDDKRVGKGTLIYKDGSYLYDGEWADDVQTGSGHEIKGQCKYTGTFLNGKYNGTGIYIDENLNQYDGEWVLGHKQGMGHWSNKSGDFYRGEFFNNLFSGHGQLNFANGDLYNGNFELGKMSKLGEYLYLNGEVHKGIFKDNKPNGRGEFIKKNGIKVEGNFINGDLDKSNVILSYEDGRVFQGSIDDKFKPHGKGVMQLSASNIVTGIWVHGIQDI